MPTTNPRINITFESSIAATLTNMAVEAGKSVSGLAKELVLEALERREDKALSNLAVARDRLKVKKIKHEDAWR